MTKIWLTFEKKKKIRNHKYRNVTPSTATIRTGEPILITRACPNRQHAQSLSSNPTPIWPQWRINWTLTHRRKKNEMILVGKMMPMSTWAILIMPAFTCRRACPCRCSADVHHQQIVIPRRRSKRRNPGRSQEGDRHELNTCALMNSWSRSASYRLGHNGIRSLHPRIHGSVRIRFLYRRKRRHRSRSSSSSRKRTPPPGRRKPNTLSPIASWGVGIDRAPWVWSLECRSYVLEEGRPRGMIGSCLFVCMYGYVCMLRSFPTYDTCTP